MGGKVIKSSVVGTTVAPTATLQPTTLEASTYFVDAAFTLPSGDDGQEVTVIVGSTASSAVSILTGAGVTLGATSISLDAANSSVTLRCFSDKWYVVSSHAATIQ